MQPPMEAPAAPATGAPEAAGPFVLETILDHGSWSARRLSKKKVRLMARIEAKVRGMLEPGERVRYVTFGTGVSFWESYWLGWAMVYLNRRAILLTDRRMILLQIDSRRRPRELVSQIRYGCIAAVRRTLLGNTLVTLGDGGRRVFAYLPRRDRAFLQKLTAWTGSALSRAPGGWEDLCPHCYVPVDGRPTACPSCGGGIKSARRAGLLSLLFPGLGDLYLGHWKFAVVEILFTALIWLAVLLPAVAARAPLSAWGAAAAILVLFIHVPDAVATWYVGRKGLYPERARAS